MAGNAENLDLPHNTEWAPHPTLPHSISKEGRIFSHRSQKEVKCQLQPDGYSRINIRINGKGKSYYLHRLVWEAWRGPIAEGMVIHHKDGDRTNSHLSNLEEVTAQENTRQYQMLRLVNRQSALTYEQIRDIRKFRTLGWSTPKIAKHLSISQRRVRMIVHKECWDYVT